MKPDSDDAQEVIEKQVPHLWPTSGCTMRLISEYCGDPKDPEWHPYKGAHLYFVPEAETTTKEGYCWAHKHFGLWRVGRMMFEQGLMHIDQKRIDSGWPEYDRAAYALASKWSELFPFGILVTFGSGGNPAPVSIEVAASRAIGRLDMGRDLARKHL